ncbi:MAG TPA: sulfate/molybdate ABC transporter ATP-binding protein [Trueperaceae bacterium]|nr:sulfate/molybdate ABC transporter ATP-binding protein [Trueperaceae bacterium]
MAEPSGSSHEQAPRGSSHEQAPRGSSHEQFEWGESLALTISDVRLSFGAAPALRGVSLAVAGGELVALLGPSGSGKTTLLRVIAGLAFADGGTVTIGEEDASNIPVQRRRIGLVFQHYALFRHMSVADNVAFGLRARPRASRPAKHEIRARTEALLELMQLNGLEKRFPAQLSGGQRQRVALARALAIQPRVLLLDEPFGALDAKVRRELRRTLREIHDRTGYTTIFVTHDQEEALEIADRVVVMKDGAIEQVGTPDDVYDAPASRFVFEFIGDSNSLPVEVRGGCVWFDGMCLDIQPTSRADGPAVLGFRPQHVERHTGEAGGLVGQIVGSRRAGGWRRFELLVGGARHRLHIDLPDDVAPPSHGSLVVVPNHWLLFDA